MPFKNKEDELIWRKEYLSRPEVKAHRKEYQKKYWLIPKTKELRKKYLLRPEVKEYQKEYFSRPEVKKRQKERMKNWASQPEVKERLKEYDKVRHHKPEFLARRIEKYKKMKFKVFSHYGGSPPKCACCGESKLAFLSIDHVNGNGNKHRKEVGMGNSFYFWLIKNNFPVGFQVLCFNCNQGRHINGGVCPHVDTLGDYLRVTEALVV